MEKTEKSKECITPDDPNILRVIPNWREYFDKHAVQLRTRSAVIAKGGTLDSFVNSNNKLEPIPHPVDIPATRGRSAIEIADMFKRHAASSPTLGSLYPWTLAREEGIPWDKVRAKYAARISSFDSGQEQPPHFTAAALYDYALLQKVDWVKKTQGTDSLVEVASLEAILLGGLLTQRRKKLIIQGAAYPGNQRRTDALHNLQGGLYAALEEALPPGVYVISSFFTAEDKIIVQVLPGLGPVKLHSDGIFHAPNTGPLLRIEGSTVFAHPLFYKLKRRAEYFSLLPELSDTYLTSDVGVARLQHALESVSVETVKNDPSILDKLYDVGTRAFVIKARGAGNAPDEWKEKVADIVGRGNTTVIVITLADSGDVNLKKYAAGLDIEGVISGRTLREDAAVVITGLIHDLRLHNQLPMQPQHLIELYCYVFGMIDVPPQRETDAVRQQFQS